MQRHCLPHGSGGTDVAEPPARLEVSAAVLGQLGGLRCDAQMMLANSKCKTIQIRSSTKLSCNVILRVLSLRVHVDHHHCQLEAAGSQQQGSKGRFSCGAARFF